jgi:hypothetical protein
MWTLVFKLIQPLCIFVLENLIHIHPKIVIAAQDGWVQRLYSTEMHGWDLLPHLLRVLEWALRLSWAVFALLDSIDATSILHRKVLWQAFLGGALEKVPGLGIDRHCCLGFQARFKLPIMLLVATTLALQAGYATGWCLCWGTVASRNTELPPRFTCSSLWALPPSFVSTWSRLSSPAITPVFLLREDRSDLPEKHLRLLEKLDVCHQLSFPTVETIGPGDSYLEVLCQLGGQGKVMQSK